MPLSQDERSTGKEIKTSADFSLLPRIVPAPANITVSGKRRRTRSGSGRAKFPYNGLGPIAGLSPVILTIEGSVSHLPIHFNIYEKLHFSQNDTPDALQA